MVTIVENDIVPALLETISKEFDEKTYSSLKLKKALTLLKNKQATYLDVNEFAVEIGEILASVLDANITVSILPDGKMYFNIADRILNSTMVKNHELISNFAVDVQTNLNHAAGLKLKGQKPELNQDRIDGLVNRLSSGESFDDIKWLLDEPLINFSQSIADDAIKRNVDFHFESGLQPKITRRLSGHACDWCKSLSGTYDYPANVPEGLYRRHERCRCTVEYNPKDSRGVQNSHSKKWRAQKQQEKTEQRKLMNIKSRQA